MALVLLSLILGLPTAHAQDPRVIGISVDQDPVEARTFVDGFVEELRVLTQQDFDVRVATGDALGAGGTLEGARAVHDRLLSDPEVDLVVSLGILVSAEIVTRRDLPKPVLAPLVLDGWLADLPSPPGGGTGVPNLATIEPVFDLADDMRNYRRLVDFDSFAVVGPPGLVALLRERAGDSFPLPGSGLRVVPVARRDDPAATIADLPSGIGAVLLIGPSRDQVADFGPLIAALTEAGVPTFSSTGEIGVRAGALAGLTPADWDQRLTRRAALHARRILLGEDPSTLPVELTRQQRLYLNMGTARALGISPTFDLMSEAELIGDLQRDPERTLGLIEVMDEAVANNRDLRAVRRDLDATRHDVGLARSNLLPQLDAVLGARHIDADRAGVGTYGAETTFTLGAELSQILWSEAAWANVTVQRHLVDAARGALRQAELDVRLEAAQSYFDVLAALANERIRRDNLRLTRLNLERARVRQRLGAASAAEEYRWESQVARDQDALVTTIARRNLTEIQLNRVLNLPLEEKLGVVEPDSREEGLRVLDPRFLPWIDDPASLRTLRAYLAGTAIENSPEIAQVDAALEVQRRLLDSETRSFFSPEVALTGDLTRTLDRRGAGADALEMQLDAGGVDDLDWSLGLGVRLPVFEGGGRYVRRGQFAATILRLQREREALAERIEQRVRSAVHVASASFTRIGLTARAEDAARSNYELVADAYAQGAVSIIELLDAQTAYFTAQQERANALFRLLADVMEVERAAGGFVTLDSDAEKDQVFEDLDAFAASRNPAQED